MIAEEGLEARWTRHRVLGDAVRAAVCAWAAPDALSLLVVEPCERSNSVTTIRTGRVSADELSRRCRVLGGVTLGVGIGELAGESFRIGHMGHVNAPMVLGVLGTVEAALTSMHAPLGGSGVAAASRVVADAFGRVPAEPV
jgi:alanine-glyoxylate transaminase/serine-glyoxylate transaminase/serine-pyruvate transaminase